MAKSKDLETEERIKETARNLYFKQGKFSVTTQEIADKAGVNRTLINYYFRSRDNLFSIIFKEAVENETLFSRKILFSDLPFKEKIENYIERAFMNAKEFPYLNSYIVTQLNQGHFYKKEEDWQRFIQKFSEDYRKEVKKGNMNIEDPLQFVFNMISLVSYPFAARPLLQSSLRISDERFDELMDERKQIIMKVLFK